jgi:hypothetical protein
MSGEVTSATKSKPSNMNSTLPHEANRSGIPNIQSKYAKHESFDVSSTGGSITKVGKRPPVDPNSSKHHIYMETSQAEHQAGVNVSYENSFSVIKKNIFKETVDKKKQIIANKAPIPKAPMKKDEEVKSEDSEVDHDTPNKPKSIDFQGP